MVLIRERENEKYLPPNEFTPKNVCYWSTTYKTFVDELGKPKANVMKFKAIKFLENNCVTYSPESSSFFVLPLKGYNKTTYEIKPIGNGLFECNCQGYQTKLRQDQFPCCSHILALKFAFKCKYFKGG